MSALHLLVDMTKCRGSGMCALIFEDGIELDRFGFPIVHGELVEGRLRRRALRASRACPHGALDVVGSDGVPVSR
jgi:ferredoxin